MKLLKLNVRMFRNLEETELSFGERFNLLYGDNAQGKTNLLESIFLLGTTKSFRVARNSDLIRWGEAACLLQGSVLKEGVSREISLLLEPNGKKVRVDGKAVTRLSDFFGSLNVVVFSPEDIAMVKGAPETRRRYLDRAVFSSDMGYLRLYHEYGRILKNRNSILKSGESALLDIWDMQLAETGARLVERRIAYLEALGPLFREFYREIAGNGEEAAIRYRPHLIEPEKLGVQGREAILAALAAHAGEERRRCTTVVGPHRDDLDFILGGKPLKQHGSQGQQRSFILALKMAEIEYLHSLYGFPPVLLLDDMTSELDRNRNRNLMEYLEQGQMQVFITTTSRQNIVLDGIEQYPAFRIEAGKAIYEG